MNIKCSFKLPIIPLSLSLNIGTHIISYMFVVCFSLPCKKANIHALDNVRPTYTYKYFLLHDENVYSSYHVNIMCVLTNLIFHVMNEYNASMKKKTDCERVLYLFALA